MKKPDLSMLVMEEDSMEDEYSEEGMSEEMKGYADTMGLDEEQAEALRLFISACGDK